MGERKWKAEGEALAELIDARFDRRSDFARQLGVSDDVLSHLIRGITRLAGERREEAARILGVPASAFRSVRSSGTPFAESAARDRGPFTVGNLGRGFGVAPAGYRHVPVFGAISAGQPGYSVSDVLETILMPEWPGETQRWGRVVTGDSMLEEFEDGDLAIFEDRAYEDGHGVHAFRDGEDTFKIYRVVGGSPKLWPTNDAYEAFSAEGWKVKGICIQRIRQGKGYKDTREYPFGFRHRTRTG